METPSIDASPSASGEEQRTKSNCVHDEQGIIDKSSDVYQRTTWDKLYTSIGYLVCKVNGINIGNVKNELLKQNLIRGKHFFCHFLIQAQLTSSSSDTHVYATLVAVINLVIPSIGELVLNSFIMKFKNAYFKHELSDAKASVIFIGHLINHNIADEKLVKELLNHIIENPSIFSIEMAIQFLEICAERINKVFEKWYVLILYEIHDLLDDKKFDEKVCIRLNKRISNLFICKFEFKHLNLLPAIDHQRTHFSTLDLIVDSALNKIEYQYEPKFELHEKTYKDLILDLQKLNNEEENGFESVTDFNNQNDGEKKLIEVLKHFNNIGEDINKISFRKTSLRIIINLIVDSSTDYKKCFEKYIKPGQEMELCFMILDCCCEHKTYKDNFGLLVKDICETNKIFVDMMEILFIHCYVTSYSFDKHKSCNIAKFFAHIFKIGLISQKFLSIVVDESISPNKYYTDILIQKINKLCNDNLVNIFLF